VDTFTGLRLSPEQHAVLIRALDNRITQLTRSTTPRLGSDFTWHEIATCEYLSRIIRRANAVDVMTLEA
jgi:hypothetical protein